MQSGILLKIVKEKVAGSNNAPWCLCHAIDRAVLPLVTSLRQDCLGHIAALMPIGKSVLSWSKRRKQQFASSYVLELTFNVREVGIVLAFVSQRVDSLQLIVRVSFVRLPRATKFSAILLCDTRVAHTLPTCRGHCKQTTSNNPLYCPNRSGRLPFNDDQQEKSVRFQSRQALHDLQINSIKAAASPVRKRRSLGPAHTGSPRTPGDDDKENDDSLHIVSGTAVTPMKRVPILANFEEWMKMATDNKINATNSWNFALIDYFHDMSLLKEGDSVNFQKASCTLDGCVKIYTSRVDSVATETGKLLSGLADSASSKKKRSGEDREGGDDDEADDGEDEDGEDGTKKRVRKKNKTAEATLAPSFAQLQLKKMELEFSVDPLFKKASADFDEGGAKGLLLNHLTIDAQGRIVFDSSDDAQEEEGELDIRHESEQQRPSSSHSTSMDDEEDAEIDVDALGERFFADLDKLGEQEICPSLKAFELDGASDSMNIPFLKAPEDWKKDTSLLPTPPPEQDSPSWDNEDDCEGLGAADIGFGEGGEVWAKEAAIHAQPRLFNAGFDAEGEDTGSGEVGDYDPDSAQYGVAIMHGENQDNILAYFDHALAKNWAGPEHWRIRKIKDASRPAQSTRIRREKEPFEIDFSSSLTSNHADTIYTPAITTSSISLPKSQWKSRSRNLLPDDKHFNSRSLLSLFLKPKARIGARKRPSSDSRSQLQNVDQEMDGAFWAHQNQNNVDALASETGASHGDYDANFFQDDGLGLPPLPEDDDDEFADAQEHLAPVANGADGSITHSANAMDLEGEGGFGTNLVTQSRRLRPEYVQYARVAKKVDVRRLKEEMWRGIGYEETSPAKAKEAPTSTTSPRDTDELKFTDVMNGLQAQYPKQAMSDISTSYCFICLLHLANEKGLVLENTPGFEELSIRRDVTADVSSEVFSRDS
ncbi:hypothetical protein FH972_020953 [Carpinus fangiana]|uniref:Condensin complex subunit 2 n=1 Tax=Carpinus fangiana TaxID=176857 RepID=A0A5N6KMW9_9ROSI|nr:hypothetical protein FH972_020953 [Carpinus fangiana]